MSHPVTMTVAEFGSRFDADLAVAKLKSAGIAAMTRNDPAASIAPHLVTDRVFSIVVTADTAEEARRVLDQPDTIGRAGTPTADELDAQFYVQGFRYRPPWIRRTTLLLLIAFAGPVALTAAILFFSSLARAMP